MPKNENIDAFWDIEDMLPKREKKIPPRRAPADTAAVEITLDAPAAEDGLPIPPKKEPREERKPEAIREYQKECGLIQSVRVLPWPTVFSFYEKFKKDAIRNFDRTHEPCEYVYFFSYMPQYEQMTVSQMAYYLYWRSEIRRGIYLKTDINYLFLYAYEVINLPEKIPPKKGAVILSRLWGAYRDDFRYLDKYLGEWLCDYCLVHNVSPDWTVLEVFADDIADKVSLPEFYIRDTVLPFGFINAVSAYDYKKSKYYEQYRAEYDRHIPEAMCRAVNRIIMTDLEAYGILPMKAARDSFSGAIACNAVKYKLEVMRYSLRRSLAKNTIDMKSLFANMIKLCENRVRAAVGVKSRFSPTGIDAALKAEIHAYFDACYPAQTQSKRTQEAMEEEAYMALYEPKQSGPADISRALAIEEEAWETAALLSTEDEELIEEAPVLPLAMPTEQSQQEEAGESLGILFSENSDGDDFDFIETALSDTEREALKAALDGRFSAYCRGIGEMAESVRARINEAAMEAIGDMIIESDFSVLADYIDEIQDKLV